MLGADITGALPELRAQAESLLIDRCDIHRAVSAWDEAQQETVATWAVVHADLPCALADSPAAVRGLLTDEAVSASNPVVKVSAGVEGVEPDDRVTIANKGVVWVTDVPVRTHQVLRRMPCRRTR